MYEDRNLLTAEAGGYIFGDCEALGNNVHKRISEMKAVSAISCLINTANKVQVLVAQSPPSAKEQTFKEESCCILHKSSSKSTKQDKGSSTWKLYDIKKQIIR
ncbi:unnamed protein product [Caretta caretta]